MKVMHHHTNGRFDWLISEHQSANPSREAISILSGKYKRFKFVHPVELCFIISIDTRGGGGGGGRNLPRFWVGMYPGRTKK